VAGSLAVKREGERHGSSRAMISRIGWSADYDSTAELLRSKWNAPAQQEPEVAKHLW